MNLFEFRALGGSFDPNAYVATSLLTFDRVSIKNPSRNHHLSGVFKYLGDGQKLWLSQQEELAIGFLTINRDAIGSLARFPGVERLAICLQVNLEIRESGLG